MKQLATRTTRAAATVLLLWAASAHAADPPVPSATHPRLFMTPANVSAFAAKAGASGTASRALVSRCQDSIDNPGDYVDRSRNLDDDLLWSGITLDCAFSWKVTGNAAHLTQAISFWRAALNDFQTLGDNDNCTVAASAYDWKNLWDGGIPRPQMFNSISADTGYPMRWYGPHLALVYDWLHDAVGVDASLLSQTRTCLTAWLDNYTLRGYNRSQPGSNYHAGFAVAKTLAAIAFGNEGTDDHLWTETVHDLFEGQMGGTALATTPSYGPLVGGDFDTWQYGPLSVAEYAVAARAIEEAGVPQPAMDAWVNSLAVRHVYAQLPTQGHEAVGNGDYEDGEIYHPTSATQLDAVILGPSSDQAAGWAAALKGAIGVSSDGFYNALAEIRPVTPQDFRAQSPAPPLWYVARGTGTIFARTSWGPDAFWGVLMSQTNHGEVDHVHWAAGNFVFSRGADHLVVDPSNYGEPGTLETNAVAADTPKSVYPPSQTPWGLSYLPWARASTGNVFAGRSEFAEAFRSNDGLSSNVPYAHREWTMLPEGEIVLVDRMHLADATKKMYLSIHTNTRPGGLALTAGAYVGTVGGSKVAIHPVLLSGNPVPYVFLPAVTNTYNHSCGGCTNARFAVDDYRVDVPGPWAVAIHVIDGLASGEAPALVGSLNDDNYDPAPKQNGGVVGAAVYRSSKQTYVVASSGLDGSVGPTMTYRVPGGSASRHVVFDAPENGAGQSVVSAAASSGSCTVTIAPGAGFAGRPLMFSLSTAQQGCGVSEDTDVAPGGPPPGDGVQPPADVVPPMVSLTAPAASATLTGTVTLSATATDNAGGSGVARVEFLVDGSSIGQVATSPFTVSYDTALVANGPHVFTARAWDAAGNSAVSAPVSATTDNSTLPPGGGGGSGTEPQTAVSGCATGSPGSPLSLAPLAAVFALLAGRRRRPGSSVSGRGPAILPSGATELPRAEGGIHPCGAHALPPRRCAQRSPR
jgi:hypothetical protein